MKPSIANELAGLEHLTVPELRHQYARLFGEPTWAANRAWLVKRIAWRMQALAEGDLSERARRRAAELANDADLRLGPPRPKKNGSAGDPPGGAGGHPSRAPRHSPASAGHAAHPRLQGPDTPGAGAGRRL